MWCGGCLGLLVGWFAFEDLDAQALQSVTVGDIRLDVGDNRPTVEVVDLMVDDRVACPVSHSKTGVLEPEVLAHHRLLDGRCDTLRLFRADKRVAVLNRLICHGDVVLVLEPVRLHHLALKLHLKLKQIHDESLGVGEAVSWV